MVSASQMKFYEKQAQIAKSIAHPLRISILEYLKDGEQCVCDIAKHVGAERSNISRHLSIMVNAGVLDYHKDGLKVIYKLKTPCIVDTFACLKRVLKNQLKEQQYLMKSV